MAYQIVTSIQQLDLPLVIYKYFNWANADSRRLLTENVAYFSHPITWNRDHELNLPRDYESVTPELIYGYYYETAPEHGYVTEEQRQCIAEYMSRNTEFHNPIHREQIERDFRNRLNKTISGFCVSEQRNNQNLWQSFAGHESGLCVGFNFREMFPVDLNLGNSGGGGQIDYYPLTTPPKIRPFNFNDEDRIEDMIKVILSLPDKYAAEREYRLIRTNLDNQEVPFDPKSVRQIIVNEFMPAEDIAAIKQLRTQKYSGSDLLKATFDESLYIYIFEPVEE